MPIARLLALILMTIQISSFAAEPVKKFDYPQDHFSIELPSTWKEIPKKILDEYIAAIAKVMPQAAKESYEYGFQLAAEPEWMMYPYVLVQVKNTGRIPEAALAKTKSLKEGMEKGMSEIEKGSSSIVSQGKVGETLYDPETKILWTNITMNVQGIGAVRGLTGVHLTERGAVCVHCYSQEKDFPTRAPVFEAIVKSVALDPALKYVPRDSDNFSFPFGAIGGVVGVIVWFAISKRKSA